MSDFAYFPVLCCAALNNIFSSPSLLHIKGTLFYSGMLLLLPEKCALYRLGFLISLIEAWNRCTVFTFFSKGKKLNASRMQKKALYHREICFLSLVSVLTFWSKNVEKHSETTAVAILASLSGNS